MYPSNKKKKVWREEKERLLKMTLEERRKEYLRDYVPLNTILSWKEEMKGKSQNDEILLIKCLTACTIQQILSTKSK
ncbi:PREDICTED: O-acetyl-ADP-ribose deacetylase MACROD2-like [Galeopterus variegatus]|uniref:O-acetyl-ADP-ribose deacetylase MACROD2-like n=1 Tax=Galeopterus variegatus TaxID=482537 RepID=A0ABM0RPE4_GALVR|nr:PREDICTED: O-acetyl-ADP-ribose deacetylase MACROD2-like [Galeopterus variegatus]